MKRGVLAGITGAVLLAGAVFAWNAVRQEREFRRLIVTGDAALTRDQTQAAVEALRRAVALDEKFAEAHYMLAMCLKDQKHDAEAVQSLTRALEINPALGAAREELAGLQLAHGKTREGIEQLEALAALEPSQPQRLVDVGLAYARLGRTTQAITALGRAAERYPEADGVYIALGQVWLESAEAHNHRARLRKTLERPQPAATRRPPPSAQVP